MLAYVLRDPWFRITNNIKDGTRTKLHRSISLIAKLFSSISLIQLLVPEIISAAELYSWFPPLFFPIKWNFRKTSNSNGQKRNEEPEINYNKIHNFKTGWGNRTSKINPPLGYSNTKFQEQGKHYSVQREEKTSTLTQTIMHKN